MELNVCMIKNVGQFNVQIFLNITINTTCAIKNRKTALLMDMGVLKYWIVINTMIRIHVLILNL